MEHVERDLRLPVLVALDVMGKPENSRARSHFPNVYFLYAADVLYGMNRGSRREYVVLTSRNRGVGFRRCAP